MRIRRAVISGAYVGPERRQSSSAERAQFATENPETVVAGRALHWLGWLPRPVLVGVTLAALLAAALLVQAQFVAHSSWVQGVNAHMVSTTATTTMTAARVDALASDTDQAKARIRRVQAEVEDLREDTLLGWLWLAENRGAGGSDGAKRFLLRLRELRDRRQKREASPE